MLLSELEWNRAPNHRESTLFKAIALCSGVGDVLLIKHVFVNLCNLSQH